MKYAVKRKCEYLLKLLLTVFVSEVVKDIVSLIFASFG